MFISKCLTRYRVVSVLNKCCYQAVFNHKQYSIPSIRHFHTSGTEMAQRSITSFFKVTPQSEKKKLSVSQESEEKGLNNEEDTVVSVKRPSKRFRIESSESENEVQKSPVKTDSVKKKKRQRIDSSGSESDKSDKQSPVKEEKPTVKLEKTSPKTYQSPKSNKKKLAKDKSDTKESPKVKREAVKTISPKSKKSPSPIQASVKQEGEESPENKKENVKPKDDNQTNENGLVPEKEYDPSISPYDPVRHACWRAGQPVPYLALARTLHFIEGTSARLKIIELLANYFRSVIALTPEDLLPSVYLCLNQLAPAYRGVELGLAETYVMKAVCACTGLSLGWLRGQVRAGRALAALAAAARGRQSTLRAPAPLALRGVFAALGAVAREAGAHSVSKKIARVQALYAACRGEEPTFLVRALEGKLRIGLADQSVLAALGLAVTLTPPPMGGELVLDASKGVSPEAFKSQVDTNTLRIKSAYCSCPSLDEIIPALLAGGPADLSRRCPLRAGLPLKPMLAHPTRGVAEVFNRFEGVEFTCEWKYDGERAQIHVPEKDGAPDFSAAAVYSRNQEDNTSKYPDIIRRLPSLLKADVTSCILDCEAVAYDTVNKQILPFQILSTRKRKDAVEGDIKVAVCVFVFDLLLLNGEALVGDQLRRRRALLREHFNEVPGEWQFATSKDCSNTEEVQQFLEESVGGSCEGLMVKTLDGDNSKYDIARRSHNWLKLKKDYLEGVGDSIDVVVLGAYGGRGRRANTYGGFLVGARDADGDGFQSLCRLGTGFTDDDLKRLTDKLKEHVIDAPRNYYSYDRSVSPDVWVSPVCVWEVKCADLSLSPVHRAAIGLIDPEKGISLRFPRFIREREDKTPEQATTSQQVLEMYLAQDQVKNQVAKVEHNMDDFY